MNRLWVHLTLAFGLVALVAVLATAVATYTQVNSQFRRFVARFPQPELVTLLTDYYLTNGTWEGVEELFNAAHDRLSPNPNSPGRGMGHGPPQDGLPDIMLLDAQERLVYSRPPQAKGRPLPEEEMANAVPIFVQEKLIGYLLVTDLRVSLAPGAKRFLEQFNQALIQAGLVAGGLGVLLGLIIAQGISAPLHQLAVAARYISQGELTRRVPERGSMELLKVARAFNDMAASLQQANLLKRNMVADIAHELRTPIAVIQGNLRAILDDIYPLDKEEIAVIYDETLILTRLVNDLRELAQAEAGQLSLKIEPLAISALIERNANLFSELANAKGISLKVVLPANLPLALADPDRIQQVLYNLLSNALRHTPGEGQITISTELLQSSPRALRISVIDTGTGIEPQQLQHVFDRFWRADKSRTRSIVSSGGSGLGLAITKQLVELHQGQVGVSSELGRGSCFWFTLPLAPSTK